MIADALRRAHLVDGVPWSQMAVIVRSVPRAAAGLPHALARAGVPVAPSAVAGPLAAQPAARALLTVLAATADGLDGEQALALLTGPIGRVDPVSLRQLRRTLRRSRNRRILKGIRRPAGRGVERRLVGPAGRGSGQAAAAGPRGAGCRGGLASAWGRPALHAVGGVAPLWFATPLADGMRARWHVRCAGRP